MCNFTCLHTKNGIRRILWAFFAVLDAYSIQDLVTNKTQLENCCGGNVEPPCLSQLN